MKAIHCALWAILLAWSINLAAQQPIDTIITYQGSLEQAGQAADGIYDFSFQLFDGPDTATGSPVGTPIVREDVAVTDGVFSVALDIPAGAFADDARWLQIGVRDSTSTGPFTMMAPFSPVTPAPQARFAVNAAQAANAIELDGLPSGAFSLSGHTHPNLSAGDGLSGADYDGTGTRTFAVGAGDGISVGTNQVSARVDGGSIGFNGSGELTLLPHGPNYGDVATVAKSGGDYTDPVAAMNDLSNWCAGPNACLLRIMPGLYTLSAPLVLDPSVHVTGVGNLSGIGAALQRDDTGLSSGVIVGSGCGFNGCRIAGLTVATATTDSGVESNAVYSEGGRLRMQRMRIVTQSSVERVYGVKTDSDTWIEDSQISTSGDTGYAVRATGGRMTISDSTLAADASGYRAIGISSNGAALILARNAIGASGADRASAINLDSSFIEDRDSRLTASGTDYSRAIEAANCTSGGITLIGTEMEADAAATRTEGIYANNCMQVNAREIRSLASGGNGRGISLRQTPLTLSRSRVEGGDDAIGIVFSPTDSNSYPIRVSHSRLTAPDVLLIEAGPFDDTAVALSRLDNGTTSGSVACVSNVDENLIDLGNSCP